MEAGSLQKSIETLKPLMLTLCFGRRILKFWGSAFFSNTTLQQTSFLWWEDYPALAEAGKPNMYTAGPCSLNLGQQFKFSCKCYMRTWRVFLVCSDIFLKNWWVASAWGFSVTDDSINQEYWWPSLSRAGWGDRAVTQSELPWGTCCVLLQGCCVSAEMCLLAFEGHAPCHPLRARWLPIRASLLTEYNPSSLVVSKPTSAFTS